ncbi:response regulator [Methylocella sp.]|uniref:response regulator n=1 Tax=Methylocella sp. TaxID=1978226 RepID=UPI003784C155
MPEAERLVLIADDDLGVRDALKFALGLEGLDVHVHGAGEELLADADLCRAACVILDDGMPKMDGFELLRRLRAANRRLPAIMLTNHATDGVRARAGAAGVHLLLEKPLLDTALVDNILSLVRAGAAAGA